MMISDSEWLMIPCTENYWLATRAELGQIVGGGGGGGSWSVLTYSWEMNRNEEIVFKKKESQACTIKTGCALFLIMFQLLPVTKIGTSVGTSPPRRLHPQICVLVRSVGERATRGRRIWERQDFWSFQKQWRGLCYSLVSQPISVRAQLFSRMPVGDNALLARSAGSKRVDRY